MKITMECIKLILNQYGIQYYSWIPAQDFEEQENYYNLWLKNKRHATMNFLENHAFAKFHPKNIMPTCKSIILFLLPYYQPKQKIITKEDGIVARYAWGKDYHKIFNKIAKKLKAELQLEYPQEQFQFYADATPLSERYYAYCAGLGFIGKNNFLIHPQLGSWFFIGEILTSLPCLEKNITMIPNLCGSCTRCLDSCPTKALVSPFEIDCNRCIAFLTIENRGEIPLSLRSCLGNHIFGCDICQECCPYNQNIETTTNLDLLHPIANESLHIPSILSLKNHEQFTNYFAGSPIMRAKYEGILRNACIVAGNQQLISMKATLQELSLSSSPIIAEHAQWAYQFLIRNS